MTKNNVGRETYGKGCSSPLLLFFWHVAPLPQESIQWGYCVLVNVCCALHRAKPRSQINPRAISRGTGMVWELDPCKLCPGIGHPWGGQTPLCSGIPRVEEALGLQGVAGDLCGMFEPDQGMGEFVTCGRYLKQGEKSWIVWLVAFEILMGKCLLSSSRFLFPGWTAHGTRVLEQKLTVKSWVACG